MHSLFFSYSHKDEGLRDQLEVQLSMLKRQGIISVWHDRRLLAGDDLDPGISAEMESADIILLLASPDFLASEYCYSKEMLRALERHSAGTARVIPVILRPCEWQKAPFGKLLATPTDGKPVTKWADRDDAFLEVAKAIRAAAESTAGKGPGVKPAPAPAPSGPQVIAGSAPRSSNLRVRKTFTEHDTDKFLDESFEFMARFFENSLEELKTRNQGYEAAFKRGLSQRYGPVAVPDSAGRAIRKGNNLLSRGNNERQQHQ